MEQINRKITELNWPELAESNGNFSIDGTDLNILTINDNQATLYFIQRIVDEEGNIEFKSIYYNLVSVIFPLDFPVERIITKDLKLKHYQLFNDVFKFNTNSIERIEVTENVETYEVDNPHNTLLFNPFSILEVVETYSSFYDEAGSYSRKLINYKSTNYQRVYFGINKEKKTLTSKGEFSFIVDRFNLPTKRTKSDFEKYLNENDLISLKEFVLSCIQKEVFDNEFLTMLNDYFIKIRLEEILKLGNEILGLKSPSTSTNIARNIISKIETDKRKIKQLESVWQKYFEQYLSYLIFSYQEIYSKIELNVDLKKKYPDFIGINHYGGVDIIEIKTHLKNVVTKDNSHDNYAFSSEMSKAIIQTINYMDALIQEKIKKKTLKEDIKGKILEGNIHRPRGIIIISSYANLAKGVKQTDPEFSNVQRDFTKLRNGLHNIQILTFDELLNMADNYKNNIVK